VTYFGSPDSQQSPTTITTTTVEKDRSDDGTSQHAFNTPNKNLKPVSSFESLRLQLANTSHESSRSDQSVSSSRSSTIASSPAQSNCFQRNEIQTIERVLMTVMTILEVCRVCWVRNEVSHAHPTCYCPTRVCSDGGWDTFKSGVQFPGGILCDFCLAPYEPPFCHKRTPPGTPKSTTLCNYPDVIKELGYILYRDPTIRTKVCDRLGVSQPSTLSDYEFFLTRRRSGGTFGIYEVVDAYLDIREEEEYLRLDASEEKVKSGASTSAS
jgi:hypothetical protein